MVDFDISLVFEVTFCIPWHHSVFRFLGSSLCSIHSYYSSQCWIITASIYNSHLEVSIFSFMDICTVFPKRAVFSLVVVVIKVFCAAGVGILTGLSSVFELAITNAVDLVCDICVSAPGWFHRSQAWHILSFWMGLGHISVVSLPAEFRFFRSLWFLCLSCLSLVASSVGVLS